MLPYLVGATNIPWEIDEAVLRYDELFSAFSLFQG